MKRIIITYLPKGWHRWNLFGDYGLLYYICAKVSPSKQEAKWYWNEEKIKKLKITIEDI